MADRNKLEVLIVDDDINDRFSASSLLSRGGYDITTSDSAFDAITLLAVRLHEGKPLPDIYLCDMIDRSRPIAKLRVLTNSFGVPRYEIKDIYIALAFHVYNYLESRRVKPRFFIANTGDVCNEDRHIAEILKIPLVDKSYSIYSDIEQNGLFPRVSGLSYEDALSKFTENWNQHVVTMIPKTKDEPIRY